MLHGVLREHAWGEQVWNAPRFKKNSQASRLGQGRGPAPPGWLSTLSIFHRKSVLYGVFVWTHRALNSLKRRFPARAVAADESAIAPDKTDSGHTKVLVTFHNEGLAAVDLHWVRPTGERKLVQPLTPGALAPMRTYEGHRWLATPAGAQEPVLMSHTVKLAAGTEQRVNIGAHAEL